MSQIILRVLQTENADCSPYKEYKSEIFSFWMFFY